MMTKYILDLDITDPIFEKGLRQVIGQLDAFALADGSNPPHMILTDRAPVQDTETHVHVVPDRAFRPGRLLQSLIHKQEAALHKAARHEIGIGEMIFLPEDKKILPGAGQPAIALTDLETRLLLHFTAHRGQTYSKEVLLKEVWEYQDGVTTHTVETHIYRLRQKLPLFESYLVTTDAGYMLK